MNYESTNDDAKVNLAFLRSTLVELEMLDGHIQRLILKDDDGVPLLIVAEDFGRLEVMIRESDARENQAVIDSPAKGEPIPLPDPVQREIDAHQRADKVLGTGWRVKLMEPNQPITAADQKADSLYCSVCKGHHGTIGCPPATIDSTC